MRIFLTAASLQQIVFVSIYGFQFPSLIPPYQQRRALEISHPFGQSFSLKGKTWNNKNENEGRTIGPNDWIRKRLQIFLAWIINVRGLFRKIFRSRVLGFTVYVLECEGSKFYVGSTLDYRRRFKEHMSDRGGSSWTRIYKPIRLVKKHRRIPKRHVLGHEAQVTAETMLRHGVNNVRGAMFSETRKYTSTDIEALTGFLGHYNNLNYKTVHAQLKEELWSPARTGSRRRKKKSNAAFYKDDICFKCGKKGHWAQHCPQVLLSLSPDEKQKK